MVVAMIQGHHWASVVSEEEGCLISCNMQQSFKKTLKKEPQPKSLLEADVAAHACDSSTWGLGGRIRRMESSRSFSTTELKASLGYMKPVPRNKT